MSTSKEIVRDNSIWRMIGMAAIVISFSLYVYATGWAFCSPREDDVSVFSMINYVIAILYFVPTLGHAIFSGSIRVFRMDRRVYLISLVLFCMSAFTLNLSITMFSDFAPWVRYYLLVILIPLLLLIYFRELPSWARIPVLFTIGLGLVLSLSFTIYLLPMAGIGIVAAFILGLSLHLLAPMILFASYIRLAIKLKPVFHERVALWTGIAIPLIYAFVYFAQWNRTLELLKEKSLPVSEQPRQLPRWVETGQYLPDNYITDQVLSFDLIYDKNWLTWDGFGTSTNSYGEFKMHDPLVWFAKELVGRTYLAREKRIQLLNIMRDKRHLAHRKLWSGEGLSTQQVRSHWDIYPEYRMAYLEKKIFIKNNNKWGNQEALYTFHLPEGAVVSSMSLMINGREEFSRLTTKHKADTAYRSIVRPVRDRPRDPSLVHWQEGNRITMTVYPCPARDIREVKIGFTIPLAVRNDRLLVRDVTFQGPDTWCNSELCSVKVISKEAVKWTRFAHAKDQVDEGQYAWKGICGEEHEFELQLVPLSPATFTFQDQHFQLTPNSEPMEAFVPERIYLDLNRNWSEKDWDYIWESCAHLPLFVYHGKMIQVTEENRHTLFKQLSKKNYSVFPFFQMESPETALLITQSTSSGPNLADLKGSPFGTNLYQHLQTDQAPIRLVELGSMSAPLHKTLKEFGVFNSIRCTPFYLRELMEKNYFKRYQNSSVQVEIPEANMLIQRADTSFGEQAPDHLMRLFVYNYVLSEAGQDYFRGDSIVQDRLIALAEEAFVVTPVSSLISLETEADYKRFGIDKNTHGLKNAGKHQSGAVPEPHEWVLLILAGLILIWMLAKRLL